MKKILLLVVLGIGVLQIVNAQIIEIIGKGTLDEVEPTLKIKNLQSVDKVVVEAAAIFEYGKTEPTDFPDEITFSSAAVEHTVPFVTVEEVKALGVIQHTVGSNIYFQTGSGSGNFYSDGYYTATFNKADISSDGIISLNKNGQGENIMTFFAYVYRTNGAVSKFSILANSSDRALVYRNGSGDALKRNFTLPDATGPRNIEVAVPLSDRDDIDDRIGVITLFSGSQQTDYKEFKLNKGDVNFHVEKVMLYDVPGNVTDVRVEIYSPTGQEGDSFIVGLPVLTVSPVSQKGCTFTQGYWKNHVKGKKADPTWDDSELPEGPNTDFFKSDVSYYEVLTTPVKGNSYYILAHQYIAAKLNFLAGADDSEVLDVFNLATRFFNAFTPEQVKDLTGDRAKYIHNLATGWAEILDNYNNGLIGPGHCDEFEPEVATVNDEDFGKGKGKGRGKGKAKGKNKSAQISTDNSFFEINDLKVFPNPVTQSATVSFSAKYEGNVTVDLYNSLGQRTTRLMDRMVNKDFPVTLSINSRDYHEGLYILRIQNELSVGTTRVQIGR